MASRRSLALSTALALALAGCESSCSVSTARLSEVQVARVIDPETRRPVDSASTFRPDTAEIYVTAKLANAPDGTRVKATFHYLEGGDREVAEDEVTADGTRYVSFTLSAPAAGWPPGQYEARLHLDGKETARAPFNVSGGTPQAGGGPGGEGDRVGGFVRDRGASDRPRGASPTREESRSTDLRLGTSGKPQGGAGTKLFRDETFGIAFELPASWSWRVDRNRAYLIEGPRGSEDNEITVSLQFIAKAANPGSSAAAQSKEALQQLLQAPDAQLRNRKTLRVAGQQAPLFVMTYTARDTRNESATFGHMHLVLDHGDHYYWIAYSAPAEIYDRRMPVMEHMLGSLRFE